MSNDSSIRLIEDEKIHGIEKLLSDTRHMFSALIISKDQRVKELEDEVERFKSRSRSDELAQAEVDKVMVSLRDENTKLKQKLSYGE